MKTPTIEDFKKFLATPRDSKAMTNQELATALSLSFIGYCARPSGIDKEILERCCTAFNNNRGKCEWEIEAIKKVLDEYRITNTPSNTGGEG